MRVSALPCALFPFPNLSQFLSADQPSECAAFQSPRVPQARMALQLLRRLPNDPPRAARSVAVSPKRLPKCGLQLAAPAPRCVLVKVDGYWYRMPSLPRMTWCRGSTLRDAGPAPERGRRRRDAASSAERFRADAPSDAGRVTVACTRSPCPQLGRATRGGALREAPHRGARTRTLVDGPCCSTVVTTTAVVQPFTSVGRPSVQRGRAAAGAENRGPRVLNVPSGTRVAGARHVVLAQFALGSSPLVAPRGHGLRGRSLGESVHPVPVTRTALAIWLFPLAPVRRWARDWRIDPQRCKEWSNP